MKKFSYFINSNKYEFLFEGKYISGKNEVLLHYDDDLIEKTNFSIKGFKIVNLKKSFGHQNIIAEVERYLKNIIEKELNNKLQDFKLSMYHKYINDKTHNRIIKKFSNGILFNKIISRNLFERTVSEILNIDVTTQNKNFNNVNANKYFLRIIRPNLKSDFNPPHKDVYIGRLKSAVNIYLPICGSNNKSALPIFPKSHKINENNIFKSKNNSKFNNKKFTVPTIVKCRPDLKLVRPNPKIHQLLIFSPYLIHGGGINENKNLTRISIEARFWRK